MTSYNRIMNINYESDELFDVFFSGGITIIERIQSLKTTDFHNKKPGTFYIPIDIDWGRAVLE